MWRGGGPRAHVSIYKYITKSYDLAAVVGNIKSLCFRSLDIKMSCMVIAAAVLANFVPSSLLVKEQSSTSVLTLTKIRDMLFQSCHQRRRLHILEARVSKLY